MPENKGKSILTPGEAVKQKEITGAKVLSKAREKYRDKAAMLNEGNADAINLAEALDATFGASPQSYGTFPILYRGNIKLDVNNKLFVIKKVE